MVWSGLASRVLRGPGTGTGSINCRGASALQRLVPGIVGRSGLGRVWVRRRIGCSIYGCVAAAVELCQVVGCYGEVVALAGKGGQGNCSGLCSMAFWPLLGNSRGIGGGEMSRCSQKSRDKLIKQRMMTNVCSLVGRTGFRFQDRKGFDGGTCEATRLVECVFSCILGLLCFGLEEFRVRPNQR